MLLNIFRTYTSIWGGFQEEEQDQPVLSKDAFHVFFNDVNLYRKVTQASLVDILDVQLNTYDSDSLTAEKFIEANNLLMRENWALKRESDGARADKLIWNNSIAFTEIKACLYKLRMLFDLYEMPARSSNFQAGVMRAKVSESEPGVSSRSHSTRYSPAHFIDLWTGTSVKNSPTDSIFAGDGGRETYMSDYHSRDGVLALMVDRSQLLKNDKGSGGGSEVQEIADGIGDAQNWEVFKKRDSLIQSNVGKSILDMSLKLACENEKPQQAKLPSGGSSAEAAPKAAGVAAAAAAAGAGAAAGAATASSAEGGTIGPIGLSSLADSFRPPRIDTKLETATHGGGASKNNNLDSKLQSNGKVAANDVTGNGNGVDAMTGKGSFLRSVHRSSSPENVQVMKRGSSSSPKMSPSPPPNLNTFGRRRGASSVGSGGSGKRHRKIFKKQFGLSRGVRPFQPRATMNSSRRKQAARKMEESCGRIMEETKRDTLRRAGQSAGGAGGAAGGESTGGGEYPLIGRSHPSYRLYEEAARMRRSRPELSITLYNKALMLSQSMQDFAVYDLRLRIYEDVIEVCLQLKKMEQAADYMEGQLEVLRQATADRREEVRVSVTGRTVERSDFFFLSLF